MQKQEMIEDYAIDIKLPEDYLLEKIVTKDNELERKIDYKN